ncbi:hypothetical protein [Fischerella thermalis]|nr:hypothetical protein [Fischerella thermalis]
MVFSSPWQVRSEDGDRNIFKTECHIPAVNFTGDGGSLDLEAIR